MGNIALNAVPTYSNLTEISALLKLDNRIDKNLLYDKLSETKEILEQVVLVKSKTVSQKWQQYFQTCTNSGLIVPVNIFEYYFSSIFHSWQ